MGEEVECGPYIECVECGTIWEKWSPERHLGSCPILVAGRKALSYSDSDN